MTNSGAPRPVERNREAVGHCCLFAPDAIPSLMEIKLPHMPFKFDSPEGRMEITVRGAPAHGESEPKQHFGAAVTFLQPGPQALKRVQLSAKGATYSGVMQILTSGFKVTPG